MILHSLISTTVDHKFYFHKESSGKLQLYILIHILLFTYLWQSHVVFMLFVPLNDRLQAAAKYIMYRHQFVMLCR